MQLVGVHAGRPLAEECLRRAACGRACWPSLSRGVHAGRLAMGHVERPCRHSGLARCRWHDLGILGLVGLCNWESGRAAGCSGGPYSWAHNWTALLGAWSGRAHEPCRWAAQVGVQVGRVGGCVVEPRTRTVQVGRAGRLCTRAAQVGAQPGRAVGRTARLRNWARSWAALVSAQLGRFGETCVGSCNLEVGAGVLGS